jgi:hypothetical protein
LFNSIHDVEPTQWDGIRSACNGSIFMDVRFIAAVEMSMKQIDRFWYIVVYDDRGTPVACTCASVMSADLADLVPPKIGGLIRQVPAIFSRLRHLKLLICGLPVGTGHHVLALAEPAATATILSVIEGIIAGLASEIGPDVVVHKEFGPADAELLKPMLNLGYQCIALPQMYLFDPSFRDFAHYCEALRASYRRNIKLSKRKLNDGGIRLSVLTDPVDIINAYTPEVHALYHQVLERAHLKLEVIPLELLHQIASQLSGHVELLAFSKDAKIIAFWWCIYAEPNYHVLYVGLDYRLNNEFDLYFNLMYEVLDRALRKGVSKIELGSTSDVFKARLGCCSEPMYVYVKGVGPFMSRVFRYGAKLFAAAKPALPSRHIFRDEIAER